MGDAEKLVSTHSDKQLYFEGFDKLTIAPKEEQTIPAYQRTKRQSTGQDKITLPADLPIERQVLDLPEEAKIFAKTGEPLVKIGEEVTSKLAHRPGSYFIKQIIRPKYALPRSEEGVSQLTCRILF